jgi:hypothetical protein
MAFPEAPNRFQLAESTEWNTPFVIRTDRASGKVMPFDKEKNVTIMVSFLEGR